MAGRPPKFVGLRNHLQQKAQEFQESGEKKYPMTFTAVETLGARLPPSAYKYAAWWSNYSYSRPWAPWFSPKDVDLKNQELTFHYCGKVSPRGIARREERLKQSHAKLREILASKRTNQMLNPARGSALGMSDAARPYSASNREPQGSPQTCRHPLYGALKGHIRLVAGTDLTQPADPEWGERIWGDDPK